MKQNFDVMMSESSAPRHQCLMMNLTSRSSRVNCCLSFTQVQTLTLWWTLCHLDHVWPDSPFLVAPSPTRYSLTSLTTMRCCATRCLVCNLATLTVYGASHPTKAASELFFFSFFFKIALRRGVSSRAAGTNSSDVCCSPTPGHARSVCRAAENGHGAAVVTWTPPPGRPHTQPGRLLQVRPMTVN